MLIKFFLFLLIKLFLSAYPQESPNPAPAWLTQRCWSEIQSLAVLPKFESFVSSFKALLPDFKKIFDAQDPEMY